MLAAVAISAILAFVHPVVCQSTTAGGDINDGASDFQPDSLTTGILALFCIFTFFFFVLAVWCFVALILSRGHRSPYAFLFPALILSFLANANNVALEVILNLSSFFLLPTQLQPALEAIGLLFTNWAILLLFLSLVAVIWNREDAIHAATEGRAGRRNHIFTAIFAILAVIIFVLGTAGPAIYVDALRQYLDALNEIDVTFDTDSAPEEDALDAWFDNRLKVSNAVNYSFSSFVVLTAIAITVPTILLWKASHAAAIRDKITDTMLYVVAPLYAFYNLLTFIFTIVFSNHGLPYTSSQLTFEKATLANNLLLLLSYFLVALALILMSINRTNWNVGGTAQPDNSLAILKMTPVQQHWSQPSQWNYGSQQHMQPYNSQPIDQPAYYYNEPQQQPYVPGPQPYETTVHSPQTEPQSLEHPSTTTTLG